jgi:ankyrin repeat protein
MQYARMEVVKFLVEEGADLNARDKVGNTPLDEAIRADAENVIDYLLERK